jgi:hypothetical protein
MADSTAAERLEPEAYRHLFPEQYFQRFLAANTRPDGRPLMRVRPTRCVAHLRQFSDDRFFSENAGAAACLIDITSLLA